jgi:hypothetical protein
MCRAFGQHYVKGHGSIGMQCEQSLTDRPLWPQFAKSLPPCDLSDAVQDAANQQCDDDQAAEDDEGEKAPSHRFAPTTNKPRSMSSPLFGARWGSSPTGQGIFPCQLRISGSWLGVAPT